MSYANATFFLDQEGGSDAARADLVPTAYANNGSGVVRVTTTNSTAAYATGMVVDIAGTTGSVYVGAWICTVIDGSHIDLQGSTFTSNPAAKGTCIPRGGSQKSDAWKTITSGATSARTQAGDTIRVMGSPAPVSVGVNGTWTSATKSQTAAVSITSSTNATPIVVTLSPANYTAVSPSVGDTVVIGSHTTNTNANGVWKLSAIDGTAHTVTLVNADGTNSVGNGVGGATGTIRKINKNTVILASNQSVSIACIGNQGTKTNWTQSTNVTTSVITSDFKEGGECQQIAIAAGFTTGLAAFLATGTLDLSGQTKASVWIKQTVGTVAIAGDYKLQLCTNADGTGGTHDIAVPALGALNQWVPVVLDNGSALNSAIKSINFTVNVDRGAVTFLVDCCYASNLTLQSLIGKNNGVNGETYCSIQSVNNVRVMLDGSTNKLPSQAPGYYGTTETVAVYTRETIKTAIAATATTAVSTPQRAGSSGSVVTFSGGWDRTNMTTQNLETWFDGINGLGIGLSLTVNFVNLDKINFVRYSTGICPGGTSGSSANCSIGNSVHANNNSGAGIGVLSSSGSTTAHAITGGVQSSSYNGSYGIQLAGGSTTSAISGNTFTPCYSLNGNANPILINTGTTYNRIGGTDHTTSCSNGGGVFLGSGAWYNSFGNLLIDVASSTALVLGSSSLPACFNTFDGVVATNSLAFGISASPFSANNYILSGNTNNNTSGSYTPLMASTAGPSITYFRNYTFNEGAPAAPSVNYQDPRVYVTAYGGDTNDNRIYCEWGTIKSQTTTRHTASGVAWQFSPTNAGRDSSYPLSIPLATFAVKANKAITLSCFIYRDDTATLVAKMLVPGGQIAGIANDVSVTASGSVNTWTQETLPSMTPTEDGVIQVFAQVYGGTTLNAYFDDISIAQAA